MLVVGAGPIGAHIMSRLVAEEIVPAARAAFLDPQPELFGQWHRRARNCGMQHLRSPASHGVDPDLRSIRRLGETDGSATWFVPPYHRPSVSLFAEHLTQRAVATLSAVAHIRDRAVRFRREEEDARYPWRVERADGAAVRASVVIIAPGPPAPRLPEPLAALPASLPIYHVHRDELPSFPPGSRIAIVGGGIAATHLSLNLPERGLDVELWNRDPITNWQFDSDPCFIGPRCSDLFRRCTDPADRETLIRRARRPGSVPPDLYSALHRSIAAGRLRYRRLTVTGATVAGRGVALRGDTPEGHVSQAQSGEFDAVIAATGFEPGPPLPEVVADIAAHRGLPVSPSGFPVPPADLQWDDGLFVAGGLGELEIGPPARNIIGAHLAGRRVVPAVARRRGARRAPRLTRARPAGGLVTRPQETASARNVPTRPD